MRSLLLLQIRRDCSPDHFRNWNACFLFPLAERCREFRPQVGCDVSSSGDDPGVGPPWFSLCFSHAIRPCLRKYVPSDGASSPAAAITITRQRQDWILASPGTDPGSCALGGFRDDAPAGVRGARSSYLVSALLGEALRVGQAASPHVVRAAVPRAGPAAWIRAWALALMPPQACFPYEAELRA